MEALSPPAGARESGRVRRHGSVLRTGGKTPGAGTGENKLQVGKMCKSTSFCRKWYLLFDSLYVWMTESCVYRGWLAQLFEEKAVE